MIMNMASQEQVNALNNKVNEIDSNLSDKANCVELSDITVVMGHIGAWNYVESNTFYIPTNKTVSLRSAVYWDNSTGKTVNVLSSVSLSFSNGFGKISSQNTTLSGKALILGLTYS